MEIKVESSDDFETISYESIINLFGYYFFEVNNGKNVICYNMPKKAIKKRTLTKEEFELVRQDPIISRFGDIVGISIENYQKRFSVDLLFPNGMIVTFASNILISQTIFFDLNPDKKFKMGVCIDIVQGPNKRIEITAQYKEGHYQLNDLKQKISNILELDNIKSYATVFLNFESGISFIQTMLPIGYGITDKDLREKMDLVGRETKDLYERICDQGLLRTILTDALKSLVTLRRDKQGDSTIQNV